MPSFEKKVPVITVDGPGGSGKGTLSLRLADHLGWNFLDSGAIYRVVAIEAIHRKIDLNKEVLIEELALKLREEMKKTQENSLLRQTMSSEIRTEYCGNIASQIAAFPKVRLALLGWQRAFRRLPGLVADGRDMGTVVFPDAQLKIYLEASIEERAKRRYLQLKDSNYSVNLQDLMTEIEMRDKRDKQRVVSPLKPAKEAVVIDTTGMAIEAVYERALVEIELHCFY